MNKWHIVNGDCVGVAKIHLVSFLLFRRTQNLFTNYQLDRDGSLLETFAEVHE